MNLRRIALTSSALGLACAAAVVSSCTTAEPARDASPTTAPVADAPDTTPAAVANPVQLVTPVVPPPAPPAPDKVQLALTPESGERFANETTTHMDISVMGIEIQTDMNQFAVLKVDDVDAEGSFSIRNKTTRIWGTMNNPMMGDVAFDTDKPPEKAQDAGDQIAAAKAQMTKQFTSMVGAEVVARLARDGSAKSIAGGATPGADQIGKMVAGVGKLPDHPVGVGDTWTTDVDSGVQGMNFKAKMKNTLKAFDADSVTVEQEGTMEMAGMAPGDKASPQAAIMSRMKTKSSSIKGTLRLSRKDGFATSSDIDTTMDMAVEADPNSQNPAVSMGMEMNMKIKIHQERKPAPTESSSPGVK